MDALLQKSMVAVYGVHFEDTYKHVPLRFIRADEDGSGVLDYSEFSALTNRLSTVPIDDTEMLAEYHKLQKSTGCVHACSIESNSNSNSKSKSKETLTLSGQAHKFNSIRPTTLRKIHRLCSV